VQPEEEAKLNRVVRRAEIEGRYLEPGETNRIVIGQALAERLDVGLDDELYVTLSGADEMCSAMLVIVGVIKTGSREIDASIAHTTLETLNDVTGYDGPGEISILLENYEQIDADRRRLAATVPPGNAVITWKQINPGFAANIEGDRAFMHILIVIIILVVSLGIASAQLTGILERRRELAILSALGMKGRQVLGLIVLEAVMIGLGGAVVALITGGSVAYYLATEGVNLATFMGEELSFGDVLFDPYIYGDFGAWLIWYALGIAEIATVSASLYPAWLAVRVDPADSLRTV
jgi:ABC-type lipoprotein release transport system permease subunit